VTPPAANSFSANRARENHGICALLGLCPVLAVTTTVENSIVISAVFFVVLIISQLVRTAISKWTSPGTIIFVLLTVSSTLTAAADMIVKAFFPGLYNSLGIYLSLIAVNCIIIARPNAGTIIDAVKTGLGYVIIILIMGIAREVLGSGTMLGNNVLGSGFRASPVSFFILPPGAFLVIAFIMAFINSNRGRRNEQSRGQV
jgi:electron transport complex protein RnfE